MTKYIFEQVDFDKFQKQMMNDISALIENTSAPIWLKTADAEKYLSCNQSTLLNLRNQGVLPSYKLGGTIYYNRLDIDRIIEQSKH